MKKYQRLFALLGLTLVLVSIPMWQAVYAQSPQVLDLGKLSANPIGVVLIVGFAGIGGLVRILIPYGRKAKDRLQLIEAQQEQGKPTRLKPLEFQWSYSLSWLLALPFGSILALSFAVVSGIDFTNWLALMVNAFVWGLTATWFTAEATT
jgi:hypothetical protein